MRRHISLLLSSPLLSPDTLGRGVHLRRAQPQPQGGPSRAGRAGDHGVPIALCETECFGRQRVDGIRWSRFCEVGPPIISENSPAPGSRGERLSAFSLICRTRSRVMPSRLPIPPGSSARGHRGRSRAGGSWPPAPSESTAPPRWTRLSASARTCRQSGPGVLSVGEIVEQLVVFARGKRRIERQSGSARWRGLLLHLFHRDVHPLGDLGRRRFASELLEQGRGPLADPMQGPSPVERNPDDPALLRQGLKNGLPDPPDRVGDELDALGLVELVRRADEAEVALVDRRCPMTPWF